MTKKEEDRIIELIGGLYNEIHENNIMLRQITKVITTYISRHHQENEEDFGRNVLANLLSGMIDLNGYHGGKY